MKALILMTFAASISLGALDGQCSAITPGPPMTLGTLKIRMPTEGVVEEAARSRAPPLHPIGARGQKEIRQRVPGRLFASTHAGMTAAALFDFGRDPMALFIRIVVAARAVPCRAHHPPSLLAIRDHMAVGASMGGGVKVVGEARVPGAIEGFRGTLLGLEGHQQLTVGASMTVDTARLEIRLFPRLRHELRGQTGGRIRPVVAATAVEPRVQRVSEGRYVALRLLAQRLEVALAALLIPVVVVRVQSEAQRYGSRGWH